MTYDLRLMTRIKKNISTSSQSTRLKVKTVTLKSFDSKRNKSPTFRLHHKAKAHQRKFHRESTRRERNSQYFDLMAEPWTLERGLTDPAPDQRRVPGPHRCSTSRARAQPWTLMRGLTDPALKRGGCRTTQVASHGHGRHGAGHNSGDNGAVATAIRAAAFSFFFSPKVGAQTSTC